MPIAPDDAAALVPAGGGPLPAKVRAAADAAAGSVLDAWRRAGLWDRLRAVPRSANGRVEALLVKVVQAAVDDPYPVHTAEDVMDHIERDGHQPAFGGALLLAIVARSRRMLKVGGRAVPLAVVAKLGTDLVTSFRLGAYELELLASLVVQRLRDDGLPVDPVTVQRITVNAYVRPGRSHGVGGANAAAAPALAAMWAGRILSVEPARGRLRKAAVLVESLDLRAATRV